MKKFFYRVACGDTVYSLAEKFGIPVTVLIGKNLIKKEPEEGDLLYLETEDVGRLYSVAPTDTLDSVAEKFCVSPQKILDENCVPYIWFGLKIKV